MRDDLFIANVVVWWGYSGSGKHGWWAKINWTDSKFCEDGAVEGKIFTRYGYAKLSDQLDCVMEVASQFGLRACKGLGINLFYVGDGESKKYPPPPCWKRALFVESKKRGWKTYKDFKEA